MIEKRKPIRSKKITDAARDQPCTICGRNDGTTVFCHLNESWAGKGMKLKADDIAGFFGCYGCHTRYDVPSRSWEKPKDWEIMRAMYRTWRNLWDRGIIGVKK